MVGTQYSFQKDEKVKRGILQRNVRLRNSHHYFREYDCDHYIFYHGQVNNVCRDQKDYLMNSWP